MEQDSVQVVVSQSLRVAQSPARQGKLRRQRLPLLRE